MHDLDRIYRESEAETFEYGFNSEGEWNEVFNESELNELASELLEVSQEQELEQFLGNLIQRVGRTLGVETPEGHTGGT